MFQFWYRWLIVLTWLIILFGLEMAFLNQTVLFDPINHQLNNAFWQSPEAPAEMIPYQQLMYGALGATTLGWGIMLLFLLRNSFAQRQRWAWWAIVISVDAWYLVDTLIAWHGSLPHKPQKKPKLFVKSYGVTRPESISRRIDELWTNFTNSWYEQNVDGAFRYFYKQGDDVCLIDIL